MLIDYSLIAEAQSYYAQCGYRPVDAPWIVSPLADYATKPMGKNSFVTEIGNFVASGEQSFIQMMMDGNLRPGRYLCVTPCFRDEKEDETHFKYFMKLELIDTIDVSDESMWNMMREARFFFEKYVDTRIDPVNEVQFDLVTKKHNIELGSYGIREFNDLKWVYGTGLALPRFTIAHEKDIFEDAF